MSEFSSEAERRRRLITRALPISILAAGSFVAGLAAGNDDELKAVTSFATAWERGDYQAMHDQLTPEASSETSAGEFEATYEDEAATATVGMVDAGEPRPGRTADGQQAGILPLRMQTRAFGEISGELTLPLEDGLIAWDSQLVFPGLRQGETLERRTRAPKRAAILAADGTPLAEGPAAARSSPLGLSASAIAGTVDTPKQAQADLLASQGFPEGSLAGTSGLELAFNDRLDGQPGGQLLAAGESDETRVLANSEPVPGEPVRTTIDPDLQTAAVTALGDLFGGVAVLDARDGAVRALAGVAFSAPQPPGSTFKLITTTAALDAGVVKLTDTFPVEQAAVIDGREVANAHDELCGGTFVESFARSCNSVFAPLGVEVGADRLVAAAEKFGFNSQPALYNAEATAAVDPPASTIPKTIDSDLDLGVSAIGQGEVLATPLQLASATQTIAAGGMRSPTPVVKEPELRPDAEPVRVTSEETAARLRQLMIEVVTNGTGAAAAIPGVQVAGKTGTAELGPAPLGPDEEPEQELDAWFTAFAPASAPKLVVAALVVQAEGDGGEIAAPIVAQVLQAGLG
ncbi:MAG: penicillin-binding transpeptidase domain-containing protein [Solirubrobacterales bacterium]